MRTRATLKAHGVQFLIARIRRTIYVWEFFFSPFVAHLFKLSLGLLQRSPSAAPAPRISLFFLSSARFLCLFFPSSAQISSYARMCASAFPCLFSGHFTVCAFGQKRQCGKRAHVRACGRDTHREETYACVRSPGPNLAGLWLRPLVKDQCRVTASLKWQQRTQTGPHSNTHAHTHRAGRRAGSGRAKVNR